MKRILALATAVLLLSGCGYVGREGEMIGQAKKLVRTTNLICPDYMSFDISLGVLQGGTGSMSTHDIWLTVRSDVDIKPLKAAVDAGAIVRVRYDEPRMFSKFCNDGFIMTGFELVQQTVK